MAKYLDENGLLYFWQKIKGTFATPSDIPTDNSALANGADYQSGSQVESAITAKGYTTMSAVEAKGYQTSSQVNTAITNKGYTTMSAVESKGYQTSAQVQSAINTALNGITGIDFQVVDSLPSTGTKGVIYLVAKSTSETNNIYTEWIYVNSKWEQLGDTKVDLSGYLQTSSTIANTEIDTITSN